MTNVFLAGTFLGSVATIFATSHTFADTKLSRNLDVTKLFYSIRVFIKGFRTTF